MFGQEEEERQHQQQQQQQHAMVIKGKRTKRLRHASPLTPLVTMSNSSSSHDDTTGIRLATSSSSTITTTQEEEDMAHCLILLAQGGGAKLETYQHHHQQQSLVGVVYECKTCNRCFPSFQALGGHRASHKKPRMTPQPDPSRLDVGMGLSLQLACNSSNTLRAINFNPNENLPNFKPKENLPNKPKAHPCGICGAEFSSGQALGGHMRRHRPLATNTMTPATPPAINLQLCLDLNLPAEEEDQEAETPKFMFGSNENTLVFTAGALVDCSY